ncbi:MAG: glycosyltransferase [Ruminococcaceae bacterium]|nr:glycosyltransferase [Oscillospiraceae bacterium]
MKISLIIPMYNENAVIEQTANRLSSYMSECFDEYEIIFFDDGSTDGSRRTVENMSLANVKVMGSTRNLGKGYAVRQGMLSADGDIRIFTDADLAYGTQVIERAYEAMCDGQTDVLIGSRNLSKDAYAEYTFIRRMMSKMYVRLVRAFTRLDTSDCQCGFKAFSAQSAQEIFSACTTDGFSFDLEVLLRAKKAQKRIVEMPVSIIEHKKSSVKPMRDTLEMLFEIRRIKKKIQREK